MTLILRHTWSTATRQSPAPRPHAFSCTLPFSYELSCDVTSSVESSLAFTGSVRTRHLLIPILCQRKPKSFAFLLLYCLWPSEGTGLPSVNLGENTKGLQRGRSGTVTSWRWGGDCWASPPFIVEMEAPLDLSYILCLIHLSLDCIDLHHRTKFPPSCLFPPLQWLGTLSWQLSQSPNKQILWRLHWKS